MRELTIQGVSIAAVGVVIGLGASFLLSRFMSQFLFGITGADLITFAGAALFLIGVAAFASLIPALRGARVDPATVLRAD